MSEWEEAYEKLRSLTASFSRVVDDSFSEIREAFDPEVEIPEGCASCVSLAELCFGRVKEKLASLNAAVKRVEEAISEEGG